MLKAAKSRAKDLDIAIGFMLADAGKMGFDDGVLTVQGWTGLFSMYRILGRSWLRWLRVTKTGGRIVAYEPDWGTFTIWSRNDRSLVNLNFLA